MRRRLVVLAAVALALGGLLLAVSVAIDAPRSSVIVVQPPTAGPFKTPATVLTEMTAGVAWTGGSPTTQTYLLESPYSTFGFSCGGGGRLLAEGYGSSGTFSVSVKPDDGFVIYACSGSHPENLTFTVTLSGGVSIAEVGGGLSLIPGGVLLYLGFARSTASATEVERIYGSRRPPAPP